MTFHEEIRAALLRGEIWPPGTFRKIQGPWWSRLWHYLTDWFTGDE